MKYIITYWMGRNELTKEFNNDRDLKECVLAFIENEVMFSVEFVQI